MNKLSKLRTRNRVDDPTRIFAKDLRTIRRVYEKQRIRLADKLENPRLKRISFYTFRHWKATTLYHQTKDILYVKQFLGHRSINNTLKYIQLEEALFKDVPDTYVCKAASTPDEAMKLIELGFRYECEFENVKIFKKPKNSGVGVLKSGVGEIQPYVYILHVVHRGVLGAA
jgi:hypothetical protein